MDWSMVGQLAEDSGEARQMETGKGVVDAAAGIKAPYSKMLGAISSMRNMDDVRQSRPRHRYSGPLMRGQAHRPGVGTHQLSLASKRRR